MTDEAESSEVSGRLERLAADAAATDAVSGSKLARAGPPVHLWNPPDCGHIPIEIRRDGSWWHEGSLIRRPELVSLFASILRREGARYYLVTPVEKFQIRIEDVPFIAVDVSRQGEGRGQRLAFRTELDDFVTADSAHPIRVVTNPATGEPTPYVMVRDRLEARINRATFYDLVDFGVEEERDG